MLTGDYGPQFVQHVSFLTFPHDDHLSISSADTGVIWDRGEPLSIMDPHHLFGNIALNATVQDNKLLVVIQGTAAKPMPASDIGIRVWGTDLYSRDVYVVDAWEIAPGTMQQSQSLVGTQPQTNTPKNMSDGTLIPDLADGDNVSNAHEQSSTAYDQEDLQYIKDWGGYSSNPISDGQLLHDMGLQGEHIPGWFSETTKWVVDGSITLQDFENALEYLDQSGAIK